MTTTITIDRLTVTVPDLDHDAMMAKKYQQVVRPEGRQERRIVAALIAHLDTKGFQPTYLHDTGEGRWHGRM